ncbi:hypothetical protein QYE76_028321 [Lolium multiflorum]|uniref:Transposase (putative) gypsy type domain-containing protein n=1 Tax=Lolium multiflorum TaxID=4521 RepID=A0AAD8QPA4_LOLMU|nr:hypothetical protein QYE76_028321 [Lolium multiflorum]
MFGELLPGNFVRRRSKAALDPSYARLIGNFRPPPIRGHPEFRAPSPTTSTSLAPRGTSTPLPTRSSELSKEGLIAPDWSFMKDSITPKPDPDESVFTTAWVERGLSLPCSEFFLSVLNTYGLQPHNICPNSYLLLCNFVTLCEGHLGIRPDIRLWQFLIRVKKETKDKVMVNCGSMTFMLRPHRMYPPHSSHESVRYWNAGWFYVKNIVVPDVHEGLPNFINKPQEELASWSFIPALAQFLELDKAARRIFAICSL